MGWQTPSSDPMSWTPLSMMGLNPVTNAALAKEKEKKAAQRAQQGTLDIWKQTAYPNQAAVNAAATENRGALGQTRMGAYQNLASNLAGRGFGSGSGMGLKGASNIENAYLQTIGKMNTDLTKFSNTPQWQPPGGAYPTAASSLGYGYGALTESNDLIEAALGYAAMMAMLGGFGGGGSGFSGGGGTGGYVMKNPKSGMVF